MGAVPSTRRPVPRARAAVIPLARRHSPLRDVSRLAPSGRSLAVGFILVALAAAAYLAARETSMFAIRRVEIRGATPANGAAVRRALAPLQGSSLLALGGDAVARRVEALPFVVSATYDRAFPHTLRVTIRVERPAAVLRRGPDSFLVSARGRVIRVLAPRALLALPRIWVPRSTDVSIGLTLGGDPGRAVAALAPLSHLHFPVHVLSAAAVQGQLTIQLRSGLELRLGDGRDLLLKLALAKQIVPTISPASRTYLDVSVPERPVAGGRNPQVGG
jgi:cell division protein FtsQ